ncbi:MAG: SMC-Scp complex subunit ScpB [bacterium]
MDIKERAALIEAVLFASSTPLHMTQIKKIVPGSSKEICAAIECLRESLSQRERGLLLREIAEGYQICAKPLYEPWLRKLVTCQQTHRLNRASLETLAIIAYKQPITRQEIDAIRGVDSIASIRTIVKKKYVTILGKRETIGRPLIYGTTPHFLLSFGLKNLADLPTLAELKGLCDEENDQT